MDHIAPLIQTILWVGLLAGIVWRFHKPIDGILSALHKRIDGGSNLKAGWFELTDQLRPQDPLRQKEKAAQEIQEMLQAEPSITSASPPTAAAAPPAAASAQARYFQAEDLVLRAIQTEYGATVSRQVTAGADMGFDGAFLSNGRLNIVEVKYIRSPRMLSRLRPSLERIAAAVSRYRWGSVQIILAVVFENSEDVSKGAAALERITTGLSIPVAIRCYGFVDLQRRFGLATEGGHENQAGQD